MSLMEVMTISFYVLMGVVIFIVLVPAIYSYTSKTKETKKDMDFRKKLSTPLQVLNQNPQVKLAWSTTERQNFVSPVYNENHTTQTPLSRTKLPDEFISNKSAAKFEVLSSLNQGGSPAPVPVSGNQPRNWSSNWQ